MATTVKGSVVLARKEFVARAFDEGSWERVVQSMSLADQQLLKSTMLHTEWYPLDFNERLDAAIVAVLANGDRSVFEEIGVRSARINLATVHRAFLTPGNPEGLLKRAQRIYARYYDTGHREYESTGPNSGVLTTYDAESYSELDCLTVIGWHKEALRMCGARTVEIEEETCCARGGKFCRYRIRWEM